MPILTSPFFLVYIFSLRIISPWVFVFSQCLVPFSLLTPPLLFFCSLGIQDVSWCDIAQTEECYSSLFLYLFPSLYFLFVGKDGNRYGACGSFCFLFGPLFCCMSIGSSLLLPLFFSFQDFLSSLIVLEALCILGRYVCVCAVVCVVLFVCRLHWLGGSGSL